MAPPSTKRHIPKGFIVNAEIVSAEEHDPSAEQEAASFSTLKSEEEHKAYALKSENKRNERLKTVVHWIMLAISFCSGALILATIFSWSAHFLLPVKYHWIEPDKLTDIQNILSGGLLAYVVGYMKNRL